MKPIYIYAIIITLVLFISLALAPAIAISQFYRGAFAGCYSTIVASGNPQTEQFTQFCDRVVQAQKDSGAFGKDWGSVR